MSAKFKLRGTTVPDDFKKELVLQCDLNFSLLEKLKLFFGYTAAVQCRVKCLNSPGRVETAWGVRVYDPEKPATTNDRQVQDPNNQADRGDLL